MTAPDDLGFACAWCGATAEFAVSSDEDESARPDDGLSAEARISHGICPRCEVKLAGELGVPVHRYLASLDIPVILVDVEAGARVSSLNRTAAAFTGASDEEARHRLLGDVFQCRNAALPEGCGRTVHCSGCVIRSSVERTWETGESLVRVPASLQPAGSGNPPVARLLISTERIQGRVVLKVEPQDA